MPSREGSYTLIRTLTGNLLACGDFRDLNAEFVAAKGSGSTDDYVPAEVEVVENWVEYREGGGITRVLFPGGQPRIETWILNVATVVSLAPAPIG